MQVAPSPMCRRPPRMSGRRAADAAPARCPKDSGMRLTGFRTIVLDADASMPLRLENVLAQRPGRIRAHRFRRRRGAASRPCAISASPASTSGIGPFRAASIGRPGLDQLPSPPAHRQAGQRRAGCAEHENPSAVRPTISNAHVRPPGTAPQRPEQAHRRAPGQTTRPQAVARVRMAREELQPAAANDARVARGAVKELREVRGRVVVLAQMRSPVARQPAVRRPPPSKPERQVARCCRSAAAPPRTPLGVGRQVCHQIKGEAASRRRARRAGTGVGGVRRLHATQRACQPASTVSGNALSGSRLARARSGAQRLITAAAPSAAEVAAAARAVYAALQHIATPALRAGGDHRQPSRRYRAGRTTARARQW